MPPQLVVERPPPTLEMAAGSHPTDGSNTGVPPPWEAGAQAAGATTPFLSTLRTQVFKLGPVAAAACAAAEPNSQRQQYASTHTSVHGEGGDTHSSRVLGWEHGPDHPAAFPSKTPTPSTVDHSLCTVHDEQKFDPADLLWLQQVAGNLQGLPSGRSPIVLVATGAFNPVHRQHVRMFYLARSVRPNS